MPRVNTGSSKRKEQVSREQEIALKGVWQPFHDEQTVQIFFRNGHSVIIKPVDGWLVITGDSTLTVRPVNERAVYVRPVGYVGPWVPEFAAKPLATRGVAHRVNRLARALAGKRIRAD